MRAYARISAAKDMPAQATVPTSLVREVAAPIMPVRPNPNLIDKLDERTNGVGTQPNSSPPAVEQPAPASPTVPNSIDPRGAFLYPGLYNSDGTPVTPGQSTPAGPTVPEPVDPHVAFLYPDLYNPDGTPRAPGLPPAVQVQPPTRNLIPGINLAPQAPISHEGTVQVDGTSYPAQIEVNATAVTFIGLPDPVMVSTAKATVNQPHPVFGGTSWTGTLDNDQLLSRIDIANPTAGVAGIAYGDTGVRITNASGTTMTVNAQGVPEGPFENPGTGAKGIAEPLPGGGYRARFADGAIADYNAAGEVVNELPAPAGPKDDGWQAKFHDGRLAVGGWITDGLAAALGATQQTVARGVGGLTSAANGGIYTPQGRAFIQADATGPTTDPSKEWKQWLDKLSIDGTLSVLAGMGKGIVAMTSIGSLINPVGEVLGFEPDVPTFDNTIDKSIADNINAAKTEFGKGNPAGGWNHIGMATMLLPDFSDPNSVLVWAATLALGRVIGPGKGTAAHPGLPNAPMPAPVKPLPKPSDTLGASASHPAAASPALPIKLVLDSQPGLTAFDLAASRAQQGLDLARLPQRMADINTAGKDLVTGVEQYVQLNAEISKPNTTPAMAHAGGPEGTPRPPNPKPHTPTGSGAGTPPSNPTRGSSHTDRSTPNRGSESEVLGPDRDGHFPDNIDTPGVRDAFDNLADRTSGATRGFVLDAATDQRIPYPYEKPGDPIVSGQKSPWTRAMDLIKKMPFWQKYGNSTPKFAADVEMKAVIAAMDEGIKNIKIVINNTDGPCPNCRAALPYLVHPEGEITVIYPGGYRTYKGSNFKED